MKAESGLQVTATAWPWPDFQSSFQWSQLSGISGIQTLHQNKAMTHIMHAPVAGSYNLSLAKALFQQKVVPDATLHLKVSLPAALPLRL